MFCHIFSYLPIFYSFIYQNLICLFFYLIDTGKLRVRAAADGEGAAVQPPVPAGEQLRATRLQHASGKLRLLLGFADFRIRISLCIAPVVWSFSSTTAQLYATHRKRE